MKRGMCAPAISVSLILVAIAVPLLFRVWDIRLLYLDATVRHDVQSVITSLARNQGVPLSSVSVSRLSTDGFRATIRVYHRGADELSCFAVDFHDQSSHSVPCDAD